MFERFTRDARAVVFGAERQAQSLQHGYIGTEHLLLAMLADDACGAGTVLRRAGLTAERIRQDVSRAVGPVADPLDALGEDDAAALRAIGIDLDAVRARVENIFGSGSLRSPQPPRGRRLGRRRGEPACFGDRLPFCPRAKKVIELGLREAIALRHSSIGSEHLLLGLLRERDGLAATVLADNGVDLGDLRRRTLAALDRAA